MYAVQLVACYTLIVGDATVSYTHLDVYKRQDLDEGAITQARLENDAQAQRLQDFIEKLEAALLRLSLIHI